MSIANSLAQDSFASYRCRYVVVAGISLVAQLFSAASSAGTNERIPLRSAFASHPHDDIKHASVTSDALPFEDTIRAFMRVQPNASNIFLTRANGITRVIEAGLRFQGERTVLLPADGDESHLWLIVFFGFGFSDPICWKTESVQRTGSRVVVTFAGPPRTGPATADSSPYFLFVPLKNLPAGKYELELRTSGAKQGAILRTVRVAQGNSNPKK